MWVLPAAPLTPVSLPCLISLESLQTCVRVSPALLSSDTKLEERRNIYRQEGNLVSPHPLAE